MTSRDVMSRDVIAVFRKYGQLVDSNIDIIEWRPFCSVLKHLKPTYYTDEVLDGLFQQLRSGAKKEEPNPGAPRENSPRRSSLAPVLRVRKLAGDTVISLTRKEAEQLSTVLRLRAEVGKAISRRIEEVNLIAGVQKLQDTETLEALLVEDTVLEVLLAIQELPRLDRSADPVTQLPALKWMLLSPQRDEQHEAASTYRRILSIEHAAPIDLVIEQGIVPRLLELCQAEDDDKLQYEAAWALTNVVSGTGEQTRVVVEAGGVPIFVRLLQSPSKDVRKQAVWALGNIAGDSWQLRDIVLQSGAMEPIQRLIREMPQASISFMRNATWTLANLCRGKPQPDLAAVSPALATLAQTLMSDDEEVLTDSSWALSYIAHGPHERKVAVLQAGVLPRLIELLDHPSAVVLTPALRTVGNIVSGTDDRHTQLVLDAGVLPRLKVLMGHTKQSIQKESCWAISNIMGGDERQIQEVLDVGLVPPLLELLRGAALAVKEQVAWALKSATTVGSFPQIQRLVEGYGCVPPMVDALATPNDKVGGLLLHSLENILGVGDSLAQCRGLDSNPWVELVVEANGVELIEAFLNSPCPENAEKAATLLTQFLGQEVLD